MYKRNQQPDTTGNTAMSSETIAATITDPEFLLKDLPALWQRITEPDGTLSDAAHRGWHTGLESLYRASGTYPQYTAIVAALTGLPSGAKCYDAWLRDIADDLARRATPGQLRQGLACEQQHPDCWSVSSHILHCVTVEQLIGPVIEQLAWNPWLAGWESLSGAPHTTPERTARHVVEHIRHQLLGADKAAWAVFLGIVEPGMIIGPTAALACAIEHQDNPHSNSQ